MERNKQTKIWSFFPEITQTVEQWMYIAADCCSQSDTVTVMFSVLPHSTYLLHIYCTNCTVCNWTVLTVITQKLLLHVQLHNSTQTVFCSAVHPAVLNYARISTYIYIRTHSVMSLDRTFQVNATATQHSVTCSQHKETHTTAALFTAVCVYSNIKSSHPSKIRCWLQAQCHSLTLIRNKWIL